ncbi:MAG: ribosome recycling factor [Myxococcales bacterium]|nr:ribosome recycling factor [Myxococcales bacterium]
MVNDVLSDLEEGITKALDALKRELAKVRTGRANLALLDGVRVDYYGTMTPLNQVASLAVADPRLITIKPWEKKLIPDIEASIRVANLGLNPSSDGEIVRLPIPSLTTERRRDLSKVVKRIGEDAKVAVRNQRRDTKEMLEQLAKDGEISDDASDVGLKKMQTSVDKAVAKVDEIIAKKEAEIMEV